MAVFFFIILNLIYVNLGHVHSEFSSKRSHLWQQANMSREDFLRYYGRSRQQHQWIVNKINTLRHRSILKHYPQVSQLQIF